MDTLDYKIPKFQVMVDILVHHGTVPQQPQEYLLYLNEFSRYRKGKETIFEFLNKKKIFIPMTYCATQEFIAMNLDDIIYVRKKETFESQTQRKVTISLRNDVTLEVFHFNPLPDSQSRLLDYLNQDSQFILFAHRNRKIFINKHKIIKATEL